MITLVELVIMAHIKKEYGIKINHANGKVEFLNYETYNSAESAAHDWQRDLGSDNASVEIIVLTMFVDNWETLDNLDRPVGEDANRGHIIRIDGSIQDSIQEILEAINRE